MFLEMTKQAKHITEMNDSLGTTRACTIYHNTLFLVAKEKTSLSLKLKQQKIKLNQFDIMLNDINDLFLLGLTALLHSFVSANNINN